MAVFALLGTLAVSCQKETAETGNVICNGDPSALVYYSIDGETFQTTISSESGWASFLQSMTSLAKNGRKICVWRNNNSQVSPLAAKEYIRFVTSSEAEAQAWMRAKEAQGYRVSMEYDKKSNEFICHAFREDPKP